MYSILESILLNATFIFSFLIIIMVSWHLGQWSSLPFLTQCRWLHFWLHLLLTVGTMAFGTAHFILRDKTQQWRCPCDGLPASLLQHLRGSCFYFWSRRHKTHCNRSGFDRITAVVRDGPYVRIRCSVCVSLRLTWLLVAIQSSGSAVPCFTIVHKSFTSQWDPINQSINQSSFISGMTERKPATRGEHTHVYYRRSHQHTGSAGSFVDNRRPKAQVNIHCVSKKRAHL